MRTAEVQTEKQKLEELIQQNHGDPAQLRQNIKKNRRKATLLKKEQDLEHKENALLLRTLTIRVKEVRISMEEREVGRRILALAEKE